MTATALDSIVFRDIFSTPEMRQVFSDENRVACYLQVEAALARVQGRLGIIPPEAAREIDSKCRVENIDFAKLKLATERIGYRTRSSGGIHEHQSRAGECVCDAR